MSKTEISWSQYTWNPVRGCLRVSPGCGGGTPGEAKGGCYAETMAARIVRMGGYEWIEGAWRDDPSKKANPAARVNADKYKPLVRINKSGEARWTGVFAFDEEKLSEPLRRKTPTVYFVNSMSDLFGEGLANEQIAAVFGVMASCPQHTFQVLTKRAARMAEWFRWFARVSAEGPYTTFGTLAACAHSFGVPPRDEPAPIGGGDVWPLPNVWLGVSCEDQQRADERIPLLLKCPAAVRWVSAEPLLGPIDLVNAGAKFDGKLDVASGERRFIHWIVWGGESGNGARLCDAQWIRDGVKQCRLMGIAPFVKQLGTACYDFETATAGRLPADFRFVRIQHEVKDKKGADPAEWPVELRVREWPRGFVPPKSKSLPVVGGDQ